MFVGGASSQPHPLVLLALVCAPLAFLGCAARASESPRTTPSERAAPAEQSSSGPNTTDADAPVQVTDESPAAGSSEPVEETSIQEPISGAAVAEETPEDDAPRAEPDGGGPVASSDAGLARAAPAECQAERWDGWDGTPACRAAARRRIAGAHRRCDTAADCVLVAEGCHPHAVNRRHAARYQRWSGPCVGPGAGACSAPQGAVCDRGCCYADQGLGGLR